MPVRIEHDLDDAGIFQIAGDRWSEGGAQHARAAQESFGSEGERRHCELRVLASMRRDVSAELSRKSFKVNCATTITCTWGAGIEKQAAGMACGSAGAPAESRSARRTLWHSAQLDWRHRARREECWRQSSFPHRQG